MAQLHLRTLRPAVSLFLDAAVPDRKKVGAALVRIAKVGEEEDGLPVEIEFWDKEPVHIAIIKLLNPGSCDAFVRRSLEQKGLNKEDEEGQRLTRLLRGALVRSISAARTARESVLAEQRTAREHEEQAQARAGEERITALKALCKDLVTREDMWKACYLPTLQALVAGEEANAQLVHHAITARLTRDPVSVAPLGPSSVGKSHLIESVANMFPASVVFRLNGFSERALHNLGPYDLKHKVLYIREATVLGADNPESAVLRSLLSEGEISYWRTVGPGAVEQWRVFGPTGFLTASIKGLEGQLATRLFRPLMDESPDQTKRVIEMIAKQHAGKQERAPDLSAFVAWQELLQLGAPYTVLIPYAEQVIKDLPTYAVRLRRDVTKIFAIVDAVAILHKEQRKTDEQGRIVATAQDYEIAYAAMRDDPFGGVDITQGQRATFDVLRALKEESAGGRVDAPMIAKRRIVTRQAIDQHLRALKASGYVENLEKKAHQPADLVPVSMPPGSVELPKPEVISAWMKSHGGS